MLETNKFYIGNTLSVLKTFPDNSIDCCMTSPPYWGLRSYGSEPQIWGGQSDCEHEFSDDIIKKLPGDPGATAQVRNTLAEVSGNSINKGGYCSKCSAWKGELGHEPTVKMFVNHLATIFDEVRRVLKPTGTFFLNIGDSYSGNGGTSEEFPAKCLCMIPSRLCIEMIDRGWVLRNDIIWEKANCMPASVKDRFTTSYEHLFFFSKSGKYYFKQQFENTTEESKRRAMRGNRFNKYSSGDHLPEGVHANTISKPRSHVGYEDMEGRIERGETALSPLGRNKRDIWVIPTESGSEAHFATFPKQLVKECLVPGVPKEVCKKCGRPVLISFKGKEEIKSSCNCDAGFEPGIVLDCFSGSGTTCEVAELRDLRWIGIDINPEYVNNIAKKKLRRVSNSVFKL